MGACASVVELKEHQEQSIQTSSSDNKLGKAKKVIDDLNIHITSLENELSRLKGQMSKEKQKKNEESHKLLRAQDQISKIESEKAQLHDKLIQISVINRKSITDEYETLAIQQQTPSDDSAQYPINIMTSTAIDMKLRFNYPETVTKCTIINKDGMVQINIPSSASCTLSIYNRPYSLKHFNFHTPSKHTIDDKQYEMEMHLVHTNQDNEICVLGFIFSTRQRYYRRNAQLRLNNEETDDFETDDDDEDEENAGNDFLNQFMDELPPQKTEKEILLKNALSFDYLFESSSKNVKKNVKTNEIEINMDIFEYMGSEGVQWLLSKTTHFINEEQLQKLSDHVVIT